MVNAMLSRLLATVFAASAALPALGQEPAPPAPAASASAPSAESATPVTGLWCGAGALHEFSLRLTQREQSVEGELVRGDRVRTIQGTVEGNVVRTQATKVGALVLERHGEELKVTGGDGPLVLARGQSFRRAGGDACSS